ncbi:DUF6884 domain-containing protein [Rhodococcus opacus]|uniref:DUF6884 domain-containing protein n=1 Tax=Rhodococcus opacus TaxID=37919 RepID=UPI001F543BB4|nr:DUF6884 domain-containing protein [Rhodococcus opacus]
MPALIRPTYRYTDPSLTPPAPGAALVMEVGLVFSRPGIGPKGGGQHGGVPLSVGPTTTLLRRHDGIEMRLPNTDLLLWNSPFLIAGHRHGVVDLRHRPGWEWLGWTLADHVMHDHRAGVATGLAHGVVPVTAGEPPPLVVIPCGARKAAVPMPAGALYLGSYHRLCQKAAVRLTPRENIRILSGLHGLLNLDTVTAPYEMRLGEPGSVTADTVYEQAAAQSLLDAEDVVILAGRLPTPGPSAGPRTGGDRRDLPGGSRTAASSSPATNAAKPPLPPGLCPPER